MFSKFIFIIELICYTAHVNGEVESPCYDGTHVCNDQVEVCEVLTELSYECCEWEMAYHPYWMISQTQCRPGKNMKIFCM